MTDTEASAAGDTNESKAEATPEQKAQRHAARVLARTLSKLGEGTPEEQKARWSENKTKYTGDARKLVRALTKDGITFHLDEANTGKAKRAGRKAKAGADAGTEG